MKISFGCFLLWLWSLSAWAGDINTATEADLDSLKGVGPATTQRILSERARRPFTDWPDLMARVKGLRPPTAKKLSAQGLTVNQTAFDDSPRAVAIPRSGG